MLILPFVSTFYSTQLLSCVLSVVILIFVIYSRRRRPDSYVTGVDPNDDVRENIIHYDEEGVGMNKQYLTVFQYDSNVKNDAYVPYQIF